MGHYLENLNGWCGGCVFILGLAKELSQIVFSHFPSLIFWLLNPDSTYRSIGAEKYRAESEARAVGKASKIRRLA